MLRFLCVVLPSILIFGCQDARYIGGYVLNVPVEGIVVAQNVKTGEVYHGKTTTIPGTLAASIEINSFKDTDLKCTGRAEIVKSTGVGKGSLGKARLLCTDARIVTAEFTYESYSSGFGIGVDTRKGVYRFVFGYNADGVMAARALITKIFKNVDPGEEQRRVENIERGV